MKTDHVARRKVAYWEWILVVALLLIAFGLRTHDLLRVPPGLHNDEVAFAEITETVTHGRLAIFFPENIGNEGLAYYFAAPFMRVLGLNVLAIRLPAAFISLIAACLIWAFTRRLFGAIAAITALASFSVIFWTVAFGRIGLHVVMLVPLATLAAYSLWRAQSATGRRMYAWWVIGGACIGASIDTYTAGRILPAILVIFGGYILVARRAEWQQWWKGIMLALFVAVLVAAPLFITLAQNPQEDQLGFFDIDRPLRELQQGNVQPVIETSLRTLGMFGFVGDPLPYYGIPGRPFLDPITFALLVGGLIIAVWRWRDPKYAFVFIWFFVSLAPGMLSQPAPNSTRTLAVQTVLFALIGIAVAAILRRYPQKVVVTGFALLFAANLIWTVHDYFTVWPSLPDTRFWHQAGLKAVADNVQRNADTSPVVVCLPDHLVDEREPWWYPAWRHVRFLLNRPDVSLRFYNCVDTLILPPGSARYAFPDAVDDATLQEFPITTLLPQADRITLPDRLGVILTADPTAALDQRLSLAAQSPVKLDGSNEVTVPIDLDGKVDFLGYTLEQKGRTAELITYWRVKDHLPPQLAQFTHVLNDKGDIVTQEDRLMLTSQSLQPNDVFAQIHHLTLPANVPPGSYPVAIGLYTQPDGKRLPIVEDQQPRGDRILLQPLVIK
ncbi:MAG TPA: glycosyltransferase family 39 protein [Anaerolineae bacterium]|nr:glycosyltransferase family 39 protein [Anaerolineae bacterium]